jgi:hypothetical protein
MRSCRAVDAREWSSRRSISAWRGSQKSWESPVDHRRGGPKISIRTPAALASSKSTYGRSASAGPEHNHFFLCSSGYCKCIADAWIVRPRHHGCDWSCCPRYPAWNREGRSERGIEMSSAAGEAPITSTTDPLAKLKLASIRVGRTASWKSRRAVAAASSSWRRSSGPSIGCQPPPIHRKRRGDTDAVRDSGRACGRIGNTIHPPVSDDVVGTGFWAGHDPAPSHPTFG